MQSPERRPGRALDLRPARACLGLALLGMALASRPAGAAEAAWSVGPRPAWVEELEPDLDAATPDDASGGAYDLLVDRQVRAAPPVTRYERHVTRVDTPSGVESASELEVEIEPAYETVTIHAVRVHRGGRALDALVPSEVRLIQPEDELDRSLYTGVQKVLVFVRDVRPGDVLDWSFSVTGQNPLLGGRFTDALDLAYGVPVHRVRHRLLWPTARRLVTRSHGIDLDPRVAVSGATTTYTWERADVGAVETEDRVPASAFVYPWAQATEFASWGEVVAWASAFFAPAELDSADLQARVDAWKRAGLSREEQALAAVRFVQDEIRYFGIHSGLHAHQPHAPAEVCARRFGDCKDKSLLLVALLRALGLEAWPAFVHTDSRRALDLWLPDAFAFDHAIVLLRLGGSDVWIDPTAGGQGGGLGRADLPCYERALVLRPGEASLRRLPCPPLDEPGTSVEETYAPDGARARLDVRTTYRGTDADDMRATLARSSARALGRDSLNRRARVDPGIEAEAPLRVVDDRARDLVVVTERYVLPAFWTEGARSFEAWSLTDLLEPPDVTRRAQPLAVEHPVHAEHVVVLDLGAPIAERIDLAIDDPAFAFRFRAEPLPRGARLRWTYRSLASEVAVRDVASHLERLGRAESSLAYEVGPSAERDEAPAARANGSP